MSFWNLPILFLKYCTKVFILVRVYVENYILMFDLSPTFVLVGKVRLFVALNAIKTEVYEKFDVFKIGFQYFFTEK